MVIIKDAAIVSVRNSSTRLPNKAIMTIKDTLRCIDIVIQRAKKTKLPVIIATSSDQSDDIFIDIARQHDVHIFRGVLLNKIKRWYDCFKKFQLKNAVIVNGDDPCFDYNIGKRSIKNLHESEVEFVVFPPDIIPGLFTYAINYSGISKLYSIVSNASTNTDVITEFIKKANLNSNEVNLNEYEKNQEMRLTLDYEEDLQFFRKLYENIEPTAPSHEITSFLEKNQKIVEINFFKHKEYLDNQRKFNESVK